MHTCAYVHMYMIMHMPIHFILENAPPVVCK